MKKIALMGAGLSALTLAQKISKKAEVFIFEKARGVGGRMSTRHGDPFYFDHGAQYWTAQTKKFQDFLKPLMNSVVAQWKGNIISLEKNNSEIKNVSQSPRFVAVPNMNSLCKHLAMGLNIKTNCAVTSIKTTSENKWRIMTGDDEDPGMYDMVISTAPAPQTLKLFSPYIPPNHMIHKADFDSCFAVMIGMTKPWDKDWVGADVSHGPIKWIGVNSTKPGRNHDLTCLVVHSDPSWTKDHLNTPLQEVEALLLKELQNLIDIDIKNLDHVSTHRWLYCRMRPLKNSLYYGDFNLGLCAFGDWCDTSDIETVWSNAEKFGDMLLSRL